MKKSFQASAWTNNAEGKWLIISKNPIIYQAQEDNCKVIISKDGQVAYTLYFKKDTVVDYTITPKLDNSKDIQMHWEPSDGLIKKEDTQSNMTAPYFHPYNHQIIENMRQHLSEANDLLEPIAKNNCFPIVIDQIFKSTQGCVAYGMIMVFLYVNASNKKGKDDFTNIIRDNVTKSSNKHYETVMFFTVLSFIASFVFMLENLFKRILENKKIKPNYGIEKIINQISKLAQLSKHEVDTLHLLREMRNSFHGNIEFGGKKELVMTLGDYTYNFKRGKSTIHQYDYSSKVILESSKILETIIKKLY